MHHLSRALATARIEDLHREAAQMHTIRLARRVTHEPHAAAASRVPIFGGRIWTGRRDGRSRRRPSSDASRDEEWKVVSRSVARVFACWRTGLSGPVIVLQAGTAVNYFGTGLILPFEIIYLHEVRGFPTATAGLVLAAVMGTAAVVTLPVGCAARSFPCEADPDHRQSRERTGLRGLRIRRPSLASLRLLGRRRRRVRSRGHREPGSEPDPGLTGAARLLDRAPPSRRQFRYRQRRDGCGLHRRFRQSTSARSRRSTSSTASPSLSSRWLCSWGSRILALRMLRRRATGEQASEQLLTIGCRDPSVGRASVLSTIPRTAPSFPGFRQSRTRRKVGARTNATADPTHLVSPDGRTGKPLPCFILLNREEGPVPFFARIRGEAGRSWAARQRRSVGDDYELVCRAAVAEIICAGRPWTVSEVVRIVVELRAAILGVTVRR